jgi:hypothetical protein
VKTLIRSDQARDVPPLIPSGEPPFFQDHSESENSYPAFGRIVRACSITADVRSRYVGGTWICPWLNVPKLMDGLSLRYT